MGMFDTVVCQYPLPDTDLREHSFQTKSLDSVLEHYTITPAGRLVYHAERRELQEDKSAPLGFYMQVVDVWDEDTEFHGELEIHDSVAGVWYEYLVYFADGQVGEIKRVTPGDMPRPSNAAQTTTRSKRYAKVFKEAVTVFGNAEGARSWLWVPNPALDGQTPLELAGSAEGAARIQKLLGELSRTKG